MLSAHSYSRCLQPGCLNDMPASNVHCSECIAFIHTQRGSLGRVCADPERAWQKKAYSDGRAHLSLPASAVTAVEA